MPDYRRVSGQPVGPFARLSLRAPTAPSLFDIEQSFPCFGILDTGSTITYVPLEILEELSISPRGESEEVFVVGGRAWFTPYIVSMEIGNEVLSNISVYGWEKSFSLIGRDVLDNFHVCFDGSSSSFEFVEKDLVEKDLSDGFPS